MKISFMNLANDDTILYDYTWLSFKSYVEDNYPGGKSSWEWSYPIRKSNYATIEELAEVVIEQDPDVLALSLYIWNAGVSLSVAEIVKTKLPKCKIIVGGPHQEYLDDDYYTKHWFIDFNSKTDGYGEVCVNEFLYQVETDMNWNEVPFLIVNDNGRAKHSTKFFNKRQFKYPENIYERNKSCIKHTEDIAENKDVKFASYEASRGCPYGCSYCEWGGGTSTKVVFKPLDIVKQDLKFLLSDVNVNVMGLTDANFGINKNDIEIAREIAELKRTTGYPNTIFFFGPTKVNKKNMFLIEDILLDSGIDIELKADIQDFDTEVMKNIDRPVDDIHGMMSEYKEKSIKYNIPYKAEFIRGLPGATLDGYYDSIDFVYEYGANEQRHTWLILSTTPASKKEYREKYKLVTRQTKQVIPEVNGNSGSILEVKNTESRNTQLTRDIKYTIDYEVVVGTFSYNLEEYVEMFLMDFIGKHIRKMLSPVLKHFITDNKASRFHREYYNSFLQGDYLKGTQKLIVDNLLKEVRSKVYSEGVVDYFEHHSLPEQLPFEILAMADIHINILANLNRKEYYSAISKWMNDVFGKDPVRDDLLEFMSRWYISIDYDPDAPYKIDLNHNWIDWFYHNQELKAVSSTIVPLTREYEDLEIDWNKYEMKDRIRKFFTAHSNEYDHGKIYFHKEYRQVA